MVDFGARMRDIKSMLASDTPAAAAAGAGGRGGRWARGQVGAGAGGVQAGVGGPPVGGGGVGQGREARTRVCM